MRIVISEFMSLDGVCQAPGGPEEDLDGGFRHGGTGESLRAGHSDELYADPDAPPVKPG